MVFLYIFTVFPDMMLTNTSCKGKILAIGFDFYMYRYSCIISSLQVWNIRPDDGRLVQPKHVAVLICYNKELCMDGLYPYCCVYVV